MNISSGAQNPTLKPARNPKVFYRQLRREIGAASPYLVNDHWYCISDILTGSYLWEGTGRSIHIRAGRMFAWMVRKQKVPFMAISLSDSPGTARFYKYIGTHTYQGGDEQCRHKI